MEKCSHEKLNMVYAVLTALFTAMISISAFIRIPIPYVPLTLQSLVIFIAGIVLGAKWGGVSVLLYLMVGLVGLPVFANGGGLGYVFQPTFGYLPGFLLAVVIIGMISRRLKTVSVLKLFAINVVGIFIIYVCGVGYFYMLNHFVLSMAIQNVNVLTYALFIPLPGDVICAFFAALIGKKVVRIVQNKLTN